MLGTLGQLGLLGVIPTSVSSAPPATNFLTNDSGTILTDDAGVRITTI